ncbi:MAG: YdcF family protein [Desulfatibacillum sp.]|nr:YdcF family protein [Desulfatibacillum sp.]
MDNYTMEKSRAGICGVQQVHSQGEGSIWLGARRLEKYDKRYGLPDTVRHALEPKDRTTFEKTLLCGELVQWKGWEKVILVTHDRHMPRSYFLHRCLLQGLRVEIQRHKAAYGGLSGKGLSCSTRMKIFNNEMIDMWGSLGEWAEYKIRCKLPDKGNPQQLWLLR